MAAFEEAAKRNFVARRGRNNRILFRSILENVFKDNAPATSAAATGNHPRIQDAHGQRATSGACTATHSSTKTQHTGQPGQNYYLKKYESSWLGKRSTPATGASLSTEGRSRCARGRKRVRTNLEICLAAHPWLQRYAQLRPELDAFTGGNVLSSENSHS